MKRVTHTKDHQSQYSCEVYWFCQTEKEDRHSDPNLEEKLQQQAKAMNEDKRKSARRKELVLCLQFSGILSHYRSLSSVSLQCACQISNLLLVELLKSLSFCCVLDWSVVDWLYALVLWHCIELDSKLM
jgi:hypothetical protein